MRAAAVCRLVVVVVVGEVDGVVTRLKSVSNKVSSTVSSKVSRVSNGVNTEPISPSIVSKHLDGVATRLALLPGQMELLRLGEGLDRLEPARL